MITVPGALWRHYRFQHPMLRDAQDKGRKTGREEGRKIGREEGREEGRRGAEETVHILLNQRGYAGSREALRDASTPELWVWVQQLAQGVLPAAFAG